nr:MAG TPA: hypothetical protein [Caudoviricetes sp.]
MDQKNYRLLSVIHLIHRNWSQISFLLSFLNSTI